MNAMNRIFHTTLTATWTSSTIFAGLVLCKPVSAQPISPTATAPRQFSYIDLVQRLTDLDHLAILPDPGEKTAQWSSYDRASRYDPKSGKYIRWNANGDGNGYIGKENDKLVLAEMAGPGCIWRIWSAMPKQGHVRIYLDGATDPAVDLPFSG